MVARFWWKDARQFWPIWVLLAVIGLAAQGLALHYFAEKARSGELAVAALGWTCLYAFAIAAAAFAGERERAGRSSCLTPCRSSAGGSGWARSRSHSSRPSASASASCLRRRWPRTSGKL